MEKGRRYLQSLNNIMLLPEMTELKKQSDQVCSILLGDIAREIEMHSTTPRGIERLETGFGILLQKLNDPAEFKRFIDKHTGTPTSDDATDKTPESDVMRQIRNELMETVSQTDFMQSRDILQIMEELARMEKLILLATKQEILDTQKEVSAGNEQAITNEISLATDDAQHAIESLTLPTDKLKAQLDKFKKLLSAAIANNILEQIKNEGGQDILGDYNKLTRRYARVLKITAISAAAGIIGTMLEHSGGGEITFMLTMATTVAGILNLLSTDFNQQKLRKQIKTTMQSVKQLTDGKQPQLTTVQQTEQPKLPPHGKDT